MFTQLIIAPEASALLPELAAFAFVARNIPSQLSADLANIDLSDVAAGISAQVVAEHPRVAIWRSTYRTMGVQASAFRSSIEQLLRRHLAGQDLTTGIAAVDLYNRISLRHLVPMGAYDLSKLTTSAVAIRPAAPAKDSFEPLGGDASKMVLTDKVLCYAQDNEILCWALNHRDSSRTCLSTDTTDAVFISESVDAAGRLASRTALEDLASTLVAQGAECGPIS